MVGLLEEEVSGSVKFEHRIHRERERKGESLELAEVSCLLNTPFFIHFVWLQAASHHAFECAFASCPLLRGRFRGEGG